MSLSVVELTRVYEYQMALAELEVALDRAAPPIVAPPGWAAEHLGGDSGQDFVARCRLKVEDAADKLRALGLDPELAALVELNRDDARTLGGDR